MAIFCVYQAVDAFKKIVEGLQRAIDMNPLGFQKGVYETYTPFKDM